MLACYIVLEFLAVYLMIESLRSAVLSMMAQGIITSIFVFEVLFYKALQLIFKQRFPLELLLTMVIGIVGIVFLLVTPSFMPPVYFSYFAFRQFRQMLYLVRIITRIKN